MSGDESPFKNNKKMISNQEEEMDDDCPIPSTPQYNNIHATEGTELSMQSNTPAKVKPLIILDISELRSNQNELKELTNRWFQDINIETMKFTQNGNLLIFPKHQEDYNKLKGINLNYKNKSVVDLTQKGVPLVLNMSFIEANSLKDDLSLKGIIEIKEIKSFRNPSLKINKVKIIVKDDETQNKFLNSGLKINYQYFRCEPFKQTIKITQCFKCQKLGHIAKFCKSNKEICAKCGKDDHTTDNDNKLICTSDKKYCVLCHQEHSSAYANCPTKKNRITEIKSRMLNTNSYSAKVQSSITPSTNFSSELQNIQNLINSQKEEILKSINNFTSKLDELSKKVDSIQSISNKNSEDIDQLKSQLNSSTQNCSNNLSSLKNFKKSISLSFIDFYAMINPQKEYSASTVSNLAILINKLGYNYDQSSIDKRLKAIGNEIIPRKQSNSRNSQ